MGMIQEQARDVEQRRVEVSVVLEQRNGDKAEVARVGGPEFAASWTAALTAPFVEEILKALGIVLIWFGVILGVNMQTSFMHPPFGFALFYLRGIAPPSVKTSDIYWGAIPWVVLQVILVAIVILWPGSVTYWLDKPIVVDPSKVKIEIPQIQLLPPTFK